MILHMLPLLIASMAVQAPAPKIGAHGPSVPGEIVRALFADHFKHEMGFTKVSVAHKAKWLTPEFLKLLNAELDKPGNPDEVPNIDGDPFTNSQEYPRRFLVGIAEIRGELTRIPVTFTGNGRRKTVAVKLRNTSEGWRVDDLVYEDGKTLRSMLGK